MSKEKKSKPPALHEALSAKYEVKSLHDGDERMLSDIMVLYTEPLTNHIKMLMGNKRGESAETADDMFQQVIIAFWRNRQNVEDIPAIEPYLYRAAKNTFINFYRKAKKSVTGSLDAFPLAPADNGMESAQDSVENKEAVSEVTEIVGTLSEQKQAVVRTNFIEGKKYEEAADEIGIPLGTYKSTVHAIKKDLRERYDYEQ